MTPDPSAAPAAAPKKKSSTATIIIIVVAVLAGGCCVMGILAAIAIPNFMKFQSRSKQSEAKVNLKMLFTAQKAHFAEKDAFAVSAEEIGFSPDSSRYTCFVSPDAVSMPRKGSPVSLDALALPADLLPGVRGECPECQFVGVCAGDIDQDETVDLWWIASFEHDCNGTPNAAGNPCNQISDVIE